MNILITGSFLFPTGMAASARLRNLAKGFKEAGAKVFVIASSPPLSENKYPIKEWIDYEEEIKLIFASNNKNKFNSKRVRKRLIYIESIKHTATLINHIVGKKKIDAVFLYGRSYLLFNSILKITEKHKIPTILDIVELPTLGLGFYEYLIHPFTLDSYLSHKKIATRVNVIASITTALEKLYDHSTSKKYLLPSIENWNEIVPLEIIKNDVYTFSYVGALLEKDAPDKLFQFVKILQEKEIDFKIKIIGRYENTSEGRGWKSKFEAESKFEKHLIWIGETTDEELALHLRSSDGLVLLRQNRKIEEYSFPTRLVEYLKTSKPVFITKKGDIPIYLNHMETACFIDPTNLSNSINDIVEVMRNKNLAKKLGEAGFEVGKEQFNRTVHADQLLTLVRQLKQQEVIV